MMKKQKNAQKTWKTKTFWDMIHLSVTKTF